jgi:serine/threonine protein phosphatase PrpC
MVSEPEITEVMRAAEESSEACQTLLSLALQKGGKDNVTVLMARYSIPNPS